jgi:hypothetical protein
MRPGDDGCCYEGEAGEGWELPGDYGQVCPCDSSVSVRILKGLYRKLSAVQLTALLDELLVFFEKLSPDSCPDGSDVKSRIVTTSTALSDSDSTYSRQLASNFGGWLAEYFR